MDADDGATVEWPEMAAEAADMAADDRTCRDGMRTQDVDESRPGTRYARYRGYEFPSLVLMI
jgi:hypothetical protein